MTSALSPEAPDALLAPGGLAPGLAVLWHLTPGRRPVCVGVVTDCTGPDVLVSPGGALLLVLPIGAAALPPAVRAELGRLAAGR